MQRKKVLMLPEWRDENPYQDLLAENLKKYDVEVVFSNYPTATFPIFSALRLNPGTNIVHLHWIAPYIERILWTKSLYIQAVKLMLMILDIFLVKLTGVKIVWTVHNLISHESKNKIVEKLIRKIISRCVDLIIFHSENNRIEFEGRISKISRAKSTIIHHGNYFGFYPIKQDGGILRPDADLQSKNILFFGQIRKYKGLDTLIDALDFYKAQNVQFVVAGKVVDKDLDARIMIRSGLDARLIYKPGFVRNDDLTEYFSWADVLVIPFESTLTSGSAILGLSMGKVLILPITGKTIGLDVNFNIYYYENNGLSACIDGLPDKSVLREMGNKNLNLIKGMDWQSSAELTSKAYQLLC